MALHKMLEKGHTPIGLLVMINQELDRSWFHGIDKNLLEKISDSLNIPLILCPSEGKNYHLGLEKGLKQAKLQGATACVFGDIDIEEHKKWCEERCKAADIQCLHPLWHSDRKKNTQEIISAGYKCIIKCIDNQKLSKKFLGKIIDNNIINEMDQIGIDVCGENGEYHTIVLGGPIFKTPIDYECKEILDFGNISAINICAK